jgi:ATP-dependent Clp protease ATP-binding subunit ClpX
MGGKDMRLGVHHALLKMLEGTVATVPGPDLLFTEAAVGEIARIALVRGTGARGLRSVVEEVLEGVLFDPELGCGT